MNDCSLNENKLLDNPIFTDLNVIKNDKFMNYIKDFDNNVIDNKILIIEMLKTDEIIKLENILNSYCVFDPVFNIVIDDKQTLKDIKDLILKIIILNHLMCFGDKDVYIFWSRLHLLNKKYQPFITEINNDSITELFDELKDYNKPDNSKIISFYKHQKNIATVLLKKHPIIKEFINLKILYTNQLHKIILDMLSYLANLEDNTNIKSIHKQLKELYIDLRELILINQLMANNPQYKFGYSLDDKTFILDHKLFTNEHENLYSNFMNNINTFEKLFNKHSISSGNKNIRKVFLLKIRTYLKYNGIKLLNVDEYDLLNINSINLKHLPKNKKIKKRINTEYIEYLMDDNCDKKKLTFRIKKNI